MEVTELSVAYHAAAEASRAKPGRHEQDETRRLLNRTVTARRKLADTEEALHRLAAGTFGHCERCGGTIPAGLLLAVPETRYCPRCTPVPVPARRRATAELSLG